MPIEINACLEDLDSVLPVRLVSEQVIQCRNERKNETQAPRAREDSVRDHDDAESACYDEPLFGVLVIRSGGCLPLQKW